MVYALRDPHRNGYQRYWTFEPHKNHRSSPKTSQCGTDSVHFERAWSTGRKGHSEDLAEPAMLSSASLLASLPICAYLWHTLWDRRSSHTPAASTFLAISAASSLPCGVASFMPFLGELAF